MIATKEYIEKKFNEYNVLIFRSSLKPIPIRLSRSRTTLGQIAYKRKRTLFGKWHYSDFKLRISTLIDQPEELIEDTILHEMIHYYILSNQIQDTSSHGEKFRSIMDDINSRYGRHITVSHHRTEQERNDDTQLRQHLVCAMRFTDGTCGLLIPTKTKLFQFWDAMHNVQRVEHYKWYVTTDPYFNRFPRTMTLKSYKISEEEIDEHLADAKPLIRNGNTISVARR